MDIITAIAAGTKAIEAAKAIMDMNSSYDSATWKGKAAELMSNVADMKITLIESNDKIKDLERSNKELMAKVAFKAEKTVYQRGFLYEQFDDGTVSYYPFCQHCLTNGKFIRMARAPLGPGAICAGCKAHVSAMDIIPKATRIDRHEPIVAFRLM